MSEGAAPWPRWLSMTVNGAVGVAGGAIILATQFGDVRRDAAEALARAKALEPRVASNELVQASNNTLLTEILRRLDRVETKVDSLRSK